MIMFRNVGYRFAKRTHLKKSMPSMRLVGKGGGMSVNSYPYNRWHSRNPRLSNIRFLLELQATRLPLELSLMPYKDIKPPAGEKITRGQNLNVPDQPVIPFIRGDGTGPDIWAASERVFNAAVEKAYGGKRKDSWFEVFAGEASKTKFDNWLPDDTVNAFKEYLVGIKGPLTTPVGGGIRSLNVALRQMLDLYVCLRPVQYFKGVPSPVKHPEKVEMVIFRENTEDIYAGIEYKGETPEAQKLLDLLAREFPKDFSKIRFGTQEKIAEYMKQAAGGHGAPPVEVGIGIKPVSAVGTI